MTRRIGAIFAFLAVALVLGAAVLSADRLVLRDGRRIEGQLVGVRGDVIEFREDRGFRGARTIEVRRDEVERIEFEDLRAREPERPDRLQPGGDRRAGQREREVWVASTSPWTDTGIDVRDGQMVSFDSHNGDIQWRRGEHTRAGGDPRAAYNRNRPLPGRPAGALIGKIGRDSTDYFFIGDEQGPLRVRGTGRLFLGINDESVNDNQGAFRVTVFY